VLKLTTTEAAELRCDPGQGEKSASLNWAHPNIEVPSSLSIFRFAADEHYRFSGWVIEELPREILSPKALVKQQEPSQRTMSLIA
jgi:hypothetical protein